MICSFAGGRWHYNHYRQPERRDHFFKRLSRSIPTLRKHMRGLRSAIISDGCIMESPPEEHRPLARSMAQQAVSLDPDNADAHIILGYLRAYEGELAEGVAECEMGLRINPSHDGGWITLADLRVLEESGGRGN